jgi:hypothetical protein
MVLVESEAANTYLHLNEREPLSLALTSKENPNNRP